MLDCKQSKLCTGWSSYAIALLVWSLVSLTIAKIINLSECCSVVVLFSALYVYYFQYFVRVLFCVDKYINVTVLQEYSGNGYACGSQLIPGHLSPDTRPGYEASEEDMYTCVLCITQLLRLMHRGCMCANTVTLRLSLSLVCTCTLNLNSVYFIYAGARHDLSSSYPRMQR